MDVTLVLTHRCNLDCAYCYAGEHTKRDMDPDTRARAVSLLFADDAKLAQLSFFGGEPFIEFESMRKAVANAQDLADAHGRELVLQCTTNGTLIDPERVAFICESGMRVTVSLDGIREAHDLQRPRAGGQSSFDEVHGGLRALIDAGLEPDVLMVVTPDTAPYASRSVAWLWDEGVGKVRANIELSSSWDAADRHAFRGELETIGWDMMARRSQGQYVSFQPFEAGMRAEAAAHERPAESPGAGTVPRGERQQVVVATGGNLYPCAPMVGEDRPDGPEAATRIGHLDDGATAIVASVQRDGTGCGNGGKCECAAFLETGDRYTGGAMGLWYAEVCRDIGAAIWAGEREDRRRFPGFPLAGRRPFLLGLALAAGRLALGGPGFLREGLLGDRRDERVAGNFPAAPPPDPPDLPVPGNMVPATPPPSPVEVEGEMAAPPEPVTTKGEMNMPPEPVDVDGDMAEPPPPPPPRRRLPEKRKEPRRPERVRGGIGEIPVLGDLG